MGLVQIVILLKIGIGTFLIIFMSRAVSCNVLEVVDLVLHCSFVSLKG